MTVAKDTLFDKHIQKAHVWVNRLEEILSWDNKQYALDAMRVSLHAIRDNLHHEEAANLSAQLPLIIKGIYFEQWTPANTPKKERIQEEFIENVRKELEHFTRQDFTKEAAEKVISSVLQLLDENIAPGEIDKLMAVVPRGLKPLLYEGAAQSKRFD